MHTEIRFRRYLNPHDAHIETRRLQSLSGQEMAEEDTPPHDTTEFRDYFESISPLLWVDNNERILCSPSANASQFRLISEPVEVLLYPREALKRAPSPNVEDTRHQRHQRRERAQQAAVDFPSLGGMLSALPSEIEQVKASNYSSSPVVLLSQTSIDTDLYKGPPVIRILKPQGRKKRKRNKPKPPRPPPSFWRPSTSMGPRASGYAYGYQGSWMVDDPSQATYKRDKMKTLRIHAVVSDLKPRRRSTK